MDVPGKLHIGLVTIQPAIVLAPMAGLTDTVFRRFIRNLSGCGLIMTEFTSSHGVTQHVRGERRKNRKFRYLHYEPDEHPIAAQLFGADPDVMAEAARIVEDNGFDILDLNFGCPVKKVVKCGGGSGLLRNLPLVEKILRKVRKAVKIPFTCKFRSGWNDKEIVAVNVARLAEDCGLQAVALHGRTREQGYSGRANWDLIGEVKQAVGIPVIGNGDVFTAEDAVAMFRQTGCDGVMIGRAASSNPWIFRQIQQYIHTGDYDQPTEQDRYEMIRDYFGALLENPDNVSGEICGKMKQFASYFTRGLRNGSELRKEIYHARTPDQICAKLDEFFAETQVCTA